MKFDLQLRRDKTKAASPSGLESFFGFGFGLILLVGGLVWLNHQRALLHPGQRVEGIIINYEQRNLNVNPGELEQRAYYPVFQFRDQSGQQHTVTSLYGGTVGFFEAPKKVLIVYPPAHPEKATVATPRYLWSTPLSLTITGLVLIALAMQALCRKRAIS